MNKGSVYPLNDENVEDTKLTDRNEVVKFVNSQAPIIEIHSQTKNVSNSKTMFRKIVLNWICGFDLDNGKSKSSESTPKIIISKEETKLEKWVLNINLIVIILTSVILFIIFSVPNGTNNLKDLKYLNGTKLNN